MFRTYEIKWNLTGWLKVRAQSYTAAREIIDNDYTPKKLVEESKLEDIIVKDLQILPE